MQVILLESIRHLGSLGDKVEVRSGFARNFLIPKKKALRVTKDALAYFDAKKAELAAAEAAAKKSAEAVAAGISGRSFVIIRQAGDTGHLYGSVTTRDVSVALKAGGADVDYAKISIDTPIKELGIYPVRVTLHSDAVEMIRVNVARTEEEARAAEEKANRPKPEQQAEAEAEAKPEGAEADAAEAGVAGIESEVAAAPEGGGQKAEG
ncbi:MAG: 50S ribosomal protein L9 [Rickettsiales bacterium]|jgi:large subunit ribosomal protein L9|nr:50S ribosomal protein L9 [Rickettsiales bacterium]